MSTEYLIRDAGPGDAAACAAIYAPYVEDTTVSFELVAPTAGEMAARMAAAATEHAWLVLERAGEVVGYAYGQAYGVRAAYRWTCEVSVYLAAGHHRAGAGRALYERLLERLEQLGYRQVMAAIVEPNAPSVALHRAMGFHPVGRFENVGWKKEQWLTVAWMQRDLGAGSGRSPSDPSPSHPLK